MATAKLLLKARPTRAQLADRLRPVDGVWPDGIELYLAAADLATPQILDDITERIAEAAKHAPQDFAWLIEGPVDSIDGADFDVTRDSQADLLVLERLAELARRIGARAVNIHLIAPSPDLSRLNLACRHALLERSVPFLMKFVELLQRAKSVPTIEHMPPVLRMRRSDFAFTPIGMAAEDLRYVVQKVVGLRTLADTSHAGLYLNARRLPADSNYVWSAPLRAYLQTLPDDPQDLVEFLETLPNLENAQISNAAGLLGEGQAYADGDFDLDPAIRWLADHTRHIVTETLEADNDDAQLMRDALRRMRVALK